MGKILVTLLLCIVCNNVAFSLETLSSWEGEWKGEPQEEQPNKRSITQTLPFRSEYFKDVVVIYNERPDRDIHYEITDECGSILQSGDVSQESSAQIVISVSELSDNGIYTIVLTSSNPSDRVYSTFQK